MKFNKILYVGAGLDVYITRELFETSEFIFVDTLPRNPYDDYIHFKRILYDNSFINKLCKEAYSLGFVFKKAIPLNSNYHKKILTFKQSFHYLFNKMPDAINPMLLLFYNSKTQQSIKYYISTNILKNMCKDLEDDISSIDALYISGYNPDSYLLFYINKPIIFIGSSKTIYDFNDYDTENLDNIDKSSLFYYLEKNAKKSEYYFSKYYIYNKIDECLEECKNFKELSQYARSTIEKYYEDSFSENTSVSYGI